ncbi:hypothetical protein H5410_012691 [Solanum commersonii]|uniref:Uncharacterized protein n=1 Tax=Solanum commersonii TaxID=4109 RepID=A0A9J6AT27_SOLCO|nr:hypothetical protein H5410_012691 [Solanum commersonii]
MMFAGYIALCTGYIRFDTFPTAGYITLCTGYIRNCASLRVCDQRHCLTFTISIDGFAISQYISLIFQVSSEHLIHGA